MKIDDLLNLHKETCEDAQSIMRAKNADYTGGSKDIFANFSSVEILGIPAELGILIRTLDKIQRLRSFIVNGQLQVKDEPVDDAIRDVVNYMVLLKGMIKDKQAVDSTMALKPLEETIFQRG